MKNLPNIEKSAFRRFEYVGYSSGRNGHVWRVRKHGCGGWEACHADSFFGAESGLRAPTLAKISEMLAVEGE